MIWFTVKRCIGVYFRLMIYLKKLKELLSKNFAVLETTYDSFYGFPTKLYIDLVERIADEEMRYSIFNFKPL